MTKTIATNEYGELKQREDGQLIIVRGGDGLVAFEQGKEKNQMVHDLFEVMGRNTVAEQSRREALKGKEL